MSLKSLAALKDAIQTGKFRFGQARRTFIPKPRGKRRPLGIPDFQDRLVQEIIKELLQVVFEPHFSPNSHGFRKGMSQHTCMRQIRRDFRGVT